MESFFQQSNMNSFKEKNLLTSALEQSYLITISLLILLSFSIFLSYKITKEVQEVKSRYHIIKLLPKSELITKIKEKDVLKKGQSIIFKLENGTKYSFKIKKDLTVLKLKYNNMNNNLELHLLYNK
jgi:hypothetical protein